MKGIHWIDLGQWPPALVITADEHAYKRFLRQQCGDAAKGCPPFPPTNGGNCQKLFDGTNCLFVIAVGKQDNPIELAATIAHEATHVMRWMFESIEERQPGLETQAYFVEHIVRHGMKALAA